LPPAQTTFALTEADLRGALLGGQDLAKMIGDGRVTVEGDSTKLAELVGYLDAPDPDFAIVTP
ncbi:alkyl sulfatase C-terminal domain-containing protein, partial [Nocardia salmonicida]